MASGGVYYLPESGSLARSLTLQGHFDLLRERFRLGPVDELIDDFDLRGLLAASTAAMSTGERRRAEMALVFIGSPSACWRTSCFAISIPLRQKGWDEFWESWRRMAAR